MKTALAHRTAALTTNSRVSAQPASSGQSSTNGGLMKTGEASLLIGMFAGRVPMLPQSSSGRLQVEHRFDRNDLMTQFSMGADKLEELIALRKQENGVFHVYAILEEIGAGVS